ncbi:shewanella-like protein phosphatase 2 [Coffea eugenioides]|uniref:Shewanella-like protein phosphatase 2 n=1 Tax=Coffea arabica TaxID=13443 RepID=A0A6P6WYZ0_COFAR|nr:shewanella-like protein phosphatase 2 [Coffea arabica]XP_027119892.1 shewanella-like protein phosphatase 2 [Coffea arabica]XP_027165196.1 shewanella-like protein phosphatase 2 [Coffea eugenioides]XP_027165197.1 shewanella-like protein phosphatase 2 [Coffea eugenioides]
MVEMKQLETSPSNITCQNLPFLLSSFVDTFVDFSVSGGLFLLPQGLNPEPKSNPYFNSNSVDPKSNPDFNSNSVDPKVSTTLQTIFPAPTRLIAIGDLHGDLSKAKQALRLAGLVNGEDRWCGGSSTVVQVGDILDRGGDELKIMYLFEKLRREAVKDGGTIITMNGNHEIMNIDGDFRFATKEGLEEFKDWAMWYCVGNDMKKLCEGFGGPTEDPFDGIPHEFSHVKPELLRGIRARIAALRPEGPIAERFLSRNQTIVVVGDSVFAHGGLLPNHVEYGLEKVNEHVRDWILGVRDNVARELVKGKDSIVWTRKYSHKVGKHCDCSTLEYVLNTIPGAKRMIMGHTIQQGGINGACSNRAIRIDVGMSKGCGNGLAEVLQINENSQITILTSNPLYQRKNETLGANLQDELGSVIPKQGQKQVEVHA